jgi:hypothetical protein
MARVKREPYTVEGPHASVQLQRPLKEFSHNLNGQSLFSPKLTRSQGAKGRDA